MDFLQDIKVADLSSRLPGPFCGHLLASFGAQVYKIEDHNHGGDPFIDAGHLQYAPNFLDWYQKLNDGKKLINLDFQREQTKLKQYLEQCQIIIYPDNSFFNHLIKSCHLDKKVLIKIAGGRNEWRFLHDLNALALTKTFKQHLAHTKTPPYLPFAGINFGFYLASISLAALHKCIQQSTLIHQTLYLKDVTKEIFDLFYSELIDNRGKFLHTGAFPCYNVYETADAGFVCFAAIEEKYWLKFQEIFKIRLSLTERFDETGKIQTKLEKLFAQLSTQDIENKLKGHSICITVAKDKKG